MASEFMPVSALNPYINAWKIKVRCTKKDDIRTWNNDRGSGKVFSVDLLDADGTEIRATMFNEAADKFDQIFQPNQVFTISGGKVKVANKRFTHIKNDYSLSLEAHSEVTPVADDDSSIDAQNYQFISIKDISQKENFAYVDLCAVVVRVDEAAEITSKRTGKQLMKRTLGLADQSGAGIDVTLWEDQARSTDDSAVGRAVCIKAARVSDFGGKSLNLSTPMVFGATRSEVQQLEAWWKSQGGNASVSTLTTGRGRGGPTERKLISEVDSDQLLGQKEKPDYFELLGTISTIIHNPEKPPWYDACPKDGCNKKLLDNGPQSWTCAAPQCEGQVFDKKQPRYIMRFVVNDSTGNKWLTVFNDGGEKILGCPAEKVSNFMENGDTNNYEKVFKNASFGTYVFKCRAKADQYRDEMRVKTTVMEVNPVDWVQESSRLIERLQGM